MKTMNTMNGPIDLQGIQLNDDHGWQLLVRTGRRELRKALGKWKTMGEPWEDVFQQALLVLLNKQDHPSWDLKHAISFLIRTGRNLMHEAHRNLNRMPTQRLDEYLGERIALVEDGEEVQLAEAQRKARKRIVKKVMDRLAPRQRAVLVGFVCEGRRFRELAQEVGYASENAAKKAKCIAMNRVRREANAEWASRAA